jgi:hypothetical protein
MEKTSTETIVELRKMEEQVAKQREDARMRFLTQAADAIACLEKIGFHYEIVENGMPKKLGRPRKGESNGQAAQVVQAGHVQKAKEV